MEAATAPIVDIVDRLTAAIVATVGHRMAVRHPGDRMVGAAIPHRHRIAWVPLVAIMGALDRMVVPVVPTVARMEEAVLTGAIAEAESN
jgi:hypothetical protein